MMARVALPSGGRLVAGLAAGVAVYLLGLLLLRSPELRAIPALVRQGSDGG